MGSCEQPKMEKPPKTEAPHPLNHSLSDGVKIMSIMGRVASERERLIGMTPEERAWRAKWVKDQILDHNEPLMPKEFYVSRYNAIRRFYRYPMDQFERFLAPRVGIIAAGVTRHVIAKMGISIMFCYATWYYMKYNRHDWTRKGGWTMAISRPALYPGDPGFPNVYRPTPAEFYNEGFEKSPI